MKTLSPEAHSRRGYATVVLAMSYQMTGDCNRAIGILYDALEGDPFLSPADQAFMMFGLCLVHWLEGDLTSIKEVAFRVLKLAEESNLPEHLTFGRYFLGIIHYVHSELAAAEPHLVAMIRDRLIARPTYFARCAFALTLSYSAQGRAEEARRVTNRSSVTRWRPRTPRCCNYPMHSKRS